MGVVHLAGLRRIRARSEVSLPIKACSFGLAPLGLNGNLVAREGFLLDKDCGVRNKVVERL